MKKIREKLRSVRVKLFLSFGFAVVLIILFLIIVNNIVLETFYLYTKRNTLKDTYDIINSYYNSSIESADIEIELEKIAINNNFDILIKTDEGLSIYTSNRDFLSTIGEMNAMSSSKIIDKNDLLYSNSKLTIRKINDKVNGLSFILLSSVLDNGYSLYIRIPVASIKDSVNISNQFLYLIGGLTILIAGVMASYISKRFTGPILELNDIAKKMSRLDFSQRYQVTDVEDEINNLGKSINIMSDKLERTIKQLRGTNIELEKDIEEKSKIDEMRKQFISDVSHELKTPIALIQGYAEGLIENVNTDEESRRFYAEVILDESNKMDILVKKLMELIKLEYGKREFNNEKFDILELIKEDILKSKVMLEENKIEVEVLKEGPIYVFADNFYIEQVFSNYLTNAIKHAKQINDKKKIIIDIKIEEQIKKAKITVFNSGDNIIEEDLNRIWNRFYKADESRSREDGGTGIGLALVKAIMNNYKNDFGVENKLGGVEFYFDVDLV